jgi:TRAP-type C4-dicarboxylate transport system permease small subunit
MARLLKWIEIPIHIMLWLGLLAGFLMMMHVTIDVAGRTVFNRPLDGSTEIVSAIYMVAVAYMPWAWIARNDSHIKVELFTSYASPRFNYWLDVVVKVVTLAYVGVFVWRSAVRAIQQTNLGEVWLAGTMYIPVWPSRWVLPISGALMCLYLVLRIVSDVTDAKRP